MSSMPSCLAGRGRVPGLNRLPGRPLALIISALVRAGLVPRSYLLTTHGRKTGRPRTNPVVPVEHGGLAPSTRPHFQATKDSPVSDFIAEADRHPVFELTSAGEDHQRGHSARVWDKPCLLMKAPNNAFMRKRRSP
jgi:hypothetical protein